MGLRDRIEALLGPAQPVRAKAPPVPSPLRRQLERIAGRSSPSPERAAAEPSPPEPLHRLLPGETADTLHGPVFLATSDYAASHLHGTWALEEARLADRADLAAVARAEHLRTLDLSTTLFLDTETTGLSGGTGTLAFLIGLGWFDGDQFQVRQAFVEDPAAERAALTWLAEKAETFTSIVTFNGKTFDLPLLQTRLTLNRVKSRLSRLPHLDLVHPARRLFKGRLEDCRLGTIEADLLGVRRVGDVPGSEIPWIYLEYLRTGDARPLVPVFTHNVWDVLSMVGILARLARGYRDPDAHPEELAAAGRVAAEAGDDVLAVQHLEAALDAARSPSDQWIALDRLGAIYKRAERWAQAVACWEGMAGLLPRLAVVDVAPLEELAKYYEHRAAPRWQQIVPHPGQLSKDAATERAAKWVAMALSITRAAQPHQVAGGRASVIARLEHRQKRLTGR